MVIELEKQTREYRSAMQTHVIQYEMETSKLREQINSVTHQATVTVAGKCEEIALHQTTIIGLKQSLVSKDTHCDALETQLQETKDFANNTYEAATRKANTMMAQKMLELDVLRRAERDSVAKVEQLEQTYSRAARRSG